MRIEDKLNLKLNKMDQSNNAKGKKGSGLESAKSSEGDSITLSSSAKEAVSVSKQLKAAPEIRVDLVNEIRDKIAEGTYDVSGRQVAEKVINAAIDDIF
jgi:negative regulator of flagellin synthesis FlgM